MTGGDRDRDRPSKTPKRLPMLQAFSLSHLAHKTAFCAGTHRALGVMPMKDQIPTLPFISCGTWMSKSPSLHLSLLIRKMATLLRFL